MAAPKLKVKVSNMQTSNGNDIPNQFEIVIEGKGTFFQSYQKVIAWRSYQGEVILDKTNWDYSMTTGKYRNIFLGETKKETERKIKEGVYKLANLN